MFTAAVVQLSCTSNQEGNLAQATDLIERAASAGADWIGTPENTNFLGPHDVKIERAETLQGPTCTLFSELAAKYSVHLLLGSFNERLADDEEAKRRCYNTSVLFGPTGDQLAVYRKIHLFDVDVSDEVRFKESDTTKAGDETVVVETPLAPFGLTICYDLRFPEIYRKLVDDGAKVLTVPSGVHPHYRQGPLVSAAASSCHRDPEFRTGPGPGRAPRRQRSAGKLWPRPDRRPLGPGPGGSAPEPSGLRNSPDRPGAPGDGAAGVTGSFTPKAVKLGKAVKATSLCSF